MFNSKGLSRPQTDGLVMIISSSLFDIKNKCSHECCAFEANAKSESPFTFHIFVDCSHRTATLSLWARVLNPLCASCIIPLRFNSLRHRDELFYLMAEKTFRRRSDKRHSIKLVFVYSLSVLTVEGCTMTMF